MGRKKSRNNNKAELPSNKGSNGSSSGKQSNLQSSATDPNKEYPSTSINATSSVTVAATTPDSAGLSSLSTGATLTNTSTSTSAAASTLSSLLQKVGFTSSNNSSRPKAVATNSYEEGDEAHCYNMPGGGMENVKDRSSLELKPPTLADEDSNAKVGGGPSHGFDVEEDFLYEADNMIEHSVKKSRGKLVASTATTPSVHPLRHPAVIKNKNASASSQTTAGSNKLKKKTKPSTDSSITAAMLQPPPNTRDNTCKTISSSTQSPTTTSAAMTLQGAKGSATNMNSSSVPCCLHCGQPAPSRGSGFTLVPSVVQVSCDECGSYICRQCHWCHEFQANHEIRVCERCDGFYCRVCDEMDQCEGCSEVVCGNCTSLMSCKFCGGGLCDDCATACGRCGIVLCERDLKFAVECDTCKLPYCLVCLASASKEACVRCGIRQSKRVNQVVHLRLKSIYKAFQQSNHHHHNNTGSGSNHHQITDAMSSSGSGAGAGSKVAAAASSSTKKGVSPKAQAQQALSSSLAESGNNSAASSSGGGDKNVASSSFSSSMASDSTSTACRIGDALAMACTLDASLFAPPSSASMGKTTGRTSSSGGKKTSTSVSYEVAAAAAGVAADSSDIGEILHAAASAMTGVDSGSKKRSNGTAGSGNSSLQPPPQHLGLTLAELSSRVSPAAPVPGTTDGTTWGSLLSDMATSVASNNGTANNNSRMPSITAAALSAATSHLTNAAASNQKGGTKAGSAGLSSSTSDGSSLRTSNGGVRFGSDRARMMMSVKAAAAAAAGSLRHTKNNPNDSSNANQSTTLKIETLQDGTTKVTNTTINTTGTTSSSMSTSSLPPLSSVMRNTLGSGSSNTKADVLMSASSHANYHRSCMHHHSCQQDYVEDGDHDSSMMDDYCCNHHHDDGDPYGGSGGPSYHHHHNSSKASTTLASASFYSRTQAEADAAAAALLKELDEEEYDAEKISGKNKKKKKKKKGKQRNDLQQKQQQQLAAKQQELEEEEERRRKEGEEAIAAAEREEAAAKAKVAEDNNKKPEVEDDTAELEDTLLMFINLGDVPAIEAFLASLKGVPGRAALRKNAKKAVKRLREQHPHRWNHLQNGQELPYAIPGAEGDDETAPVIVDEDDGFITPGAIKGNHQHSKSNTDNAAIPSATNSASDSAVARSIVASIASSSINAAGDGVHHPRAGGGSASGIKGIPQVVATPASASSKTVPQAPLPPAVLDPRLPLMKVVKHTTILAPGGGDTKSPFYEPRTKSALSSTSGGGSTTSSSLSNSAHAQTSAPSPARTEAVLHMSPAVIGWVIGKGGQRIRDIMEEASCRIWIDQERLVQEETNINSAQNDASSGSGGGQYRVVYVSGGKKNVDAAVKRLTDLVSKAPIHEKMRELDKQQQQQERENKKTRAKLPSPVVSRESSSGQIASSITGATSAASTTTSAATAAGNVNASTIAITPSLLKPPNSRKGNAWGVSAAQAPSSTTSAGAPAPRPQMVASAANHASTASASLPRSRPPPVPAGAGFSRPTPQIQVPTFEPVTNPNDFPTLDETSMSQHKSHLSFAETHPLTGVSLISESSALPQSQQPMLLEQQSENMNVFHQATRNLPKQPFQQPPRFHQQQPPQQHQMSRSSVPPGYNAPPGYSENNAGSPFRSVSSSAQPYSATGGELQYNPKTNEFVELLQCEAQVVDHLLVGHMGWALKQIQDETGARVDIEQLQNQHRNQFQNQRTIQICAALKEQVHRATQMVLGVIMNPPPQAKNIQPPRDHHHGDGLWAPSGTSNNAAPEMFFPKMSSPVRTPSLPQPAMTQQSTLSSPARQASGNPGNTTTEAAVASAMQLDLDMYSTTQSVLAGLYSPQRPSESTLQVSLSPLEHITINAGRGERGVGPGPQLPSWSSDATGGGGPKTGTSLVSSSDPFAVNTAVIGGYFPPQASAKRSSGIWSLSDGAQPPPNLPPHSSGVTRNSVDANNTDNSGLDLLGSALHQYTSTGTTTSSTNRSASAGGESRMMGFFNSTGTGIGTAYSEVAPRVENSILAPAGNSGFLGNELFGVGEESASGRPAGGMEHTAGGQNFGGGWRQPQSTALHETVVSSRASGSPSLVYTSDGGGWGQPPQTTTLDPRGLTFSSSLAENALPFHPPGMKQHRQQREPMILPSSVPGASSNFVEPQSYQGQPLWNRGSNNNNQRSDSSDNVYQQQYW
jgi:hypothetical protein